MNLFTPLFVAIVAGLYTIPRLVYLAYIDETKDIPVLELLCVALLSYAIGCFSGSYDAKLWPSSTASTVIQSFGLAVIVGATAFYRSHVSFSGFWVAGALVLSAVNLALWS